MATNPDYLYSNLSRRDFVKRAGGCAGLSSISILSTILNLKMTQSAVAASNPGGYKGLVCLFAFGGMDSRNLLAPYDPTEWDGYRTIRQGLHYETPNGVALPRADDLTFGDSNRGMSLKKIIPKPTNPINGGRDFGIHGYFNANRNESNGVPIADSEDYMRDLYRAGNLTFVCNVGSLVNPDTRWDNWQSFRPVGLFSHSDEQRNWMTAMPETQAQNIGFLGRTADMLLASHNQNSNISMNIVMDAFRTMSVGENTLPYVITDSGAHRYLPGRYPRTSPANHRDTIVSEWMKEGPNKLLRDDLTNLLELSHSTSRRDAIDLALEYNTATTGITLKTENPSDPAFIGPWPTHGVGRDMRQVVESIIAREALKQDRQIFFLSRGGFDNHTNLIGNHSTTLPQMGETVYRFWKEIEAQGLEDCVTLFTASDFERTYGPNSNKGTDHAWASNQFVVGGSQINGGDVVGIQPDSSDPSKFVSSTRATRIYSTDTRGRVFPSHSVDEYMAELIQWFGDFSDSDLELILPNLKNFSGRQKIGHMA